MDEATDRASDNLHGRRSGDEIDWAAILIGVRNPNTGKVEGGLVNSVERIADRVRWSAIVDSWILRILLGLAIIKWLGIDHATDVAKLLHIL